MSSSSETSVIISYRGLPLKCVCGERVVKFTSKTQDNPGRPFFRCISKRDASSWTSKRDGHLFKWVEDAIYEEVEDALPKLGIMANEIVKAKAEINELNVAMQELKEDAMQRKRDICKLKLLWKMCFLWLCVITIFIVYLMVGNVKQPKFVLGY
ncbi:PREDICTED: uncharacterized protein At1g43920, Chloroplastic-like [Camelina sativa]|uniref:Uncharacterized protein At1g43920, Chloroplastic-like n=1 Tax=Camelina sativa TaxID=90675 RepID=A0ABM0Y506_CAMSA|nr:PREDICTED: uncharacterized protein At1g43920, Chloroplastic-like [Camelina sativa]